ncbi:hypothetical protein D083_3305 [Dickeya solani RNS 08.23.3.1.A]|nr:hypothetical protein D083_3305 [Dickeya solani RNS 08.23.3.1.A]
MSLLLNVLVIKRHGYQASWLSNILFIKHIVSSAVTGTWPVFGENGVI